MLAAADREAMEGFDSTTLRERVVRHLRESILSGRMPPGSVLQEVPLAASLGVSRGPLREALGDLAAEGLVTLTPRRGAVVSSYTKRDFLESCQVRAALEALAVRVAVPRLRAADLAAFEASQARLLACDAEDDGPGVFDAKVAYHEAWMAAADNALLSETHARLVTRMRVYRRPSALLRGSPERSLAEHAAITDAAREGDAELASERMLRHILVPQERLRELSDERFADEIRRSMAAMAGSAGDRAQAPQRDPAGVSARSRG